MELQLQLLMLLSVIVSIIRPSSQADPVTGVPSLLFAAAIGNVTEIKRILVAGANVNERDWIGQTALHMAAKFGFPAAIETLLRRGANPNARNADYNETPLHCAAKTGNIAIFELLLRYGADIDAAADTGDYAGGTALHFTTALANSVAAVRYLLDNGAKVNAGNYLYNETPLHLAVKNENLQIMRLLLSRGAHLEARDWRGNTPLHTAVMTEEPQIWTAKFLIDRGASTAAQNFEGKTALQLAEAKASPGMMLLLKGELKGGYLPLHKGAAYNNGTILRALLNPKTGKMTKKDRSYMINQLSLDQFQRTPLHTAVQFQNFEATKYLLDNGADVNARKWDGLMPLHLAAKTGNLAIMELLLQRGALVNGGGSVPPLFMAVSFANAFTPALVKLIANGASVTDPRLIHEAVMSQNMRHIELLVNSGANINAKTTPEMETPLSSLLISECCYPQIPVLRYLINRGASLTAVDHFGYTPLHKAIIGRKRHVVIDYLLNRGADPNALDGRGCNAPLYLATRLAFSGDHFTTGFGVNLANENETAKLLRLLVRSGGRVDALDQCSEQTALQLVLQNDEAPNREEIASILRQPKDTY